MTVRKIVFWAHLSAGIAAGLLILNAAFTGLLIAFEGQIVEVAERGVRRVPAPTDGARLDLEALAVEAWDAVPGARLTAATVSSDPRASVSFQFGRDGGTVYVDPYAGAVLGKDSGIGRVLHAVEDWHRWLWSREAGKPVTGAACLVFLAMVLGGLYLWWQGRTWRLGKGLSGRARDWNWHSVAGVWFAPFMLITALTGAVMSFDWANDLLFRAAGTPPPPRRAAPRNPGVGEEKPVPVFALTPLVAKASAQVSVWEAITLRFPRKEGDPATATILEPARLGPPRRSQLTLDPKTAEVLQWEPFQEQDAGREARAWARYLHTGEAFGWPGQLAAFASSCAVLLLVWTGLSLSWRRFFGRPTA